MNASSDAAHDIAVAGMPHRLHHFAYTTYDIERIRHFYEDVIGMPLRQTWVEHRVLEDGTHDEYVHCFFGLADGSAIAHLEHAGWTEPKDRSPSAPFHVAFKVDKETQDAIVSRLHENGLREERVTDHGYCVSLYVYDPDGLRLEFTVDHPQIDEIVARQNRIAHAELRRWLSGDRAANNDWRPEH